MIAIASLSIAIQFPIVCLAGPDRPTGSHEKASVPAKAGDQKTQLSTPIPDEERRILKAFEQKSTWDKYTKKRMPLDQFIEDFQKRAGIPVRLDIKALEEAGIDVKDDVEIPAGVHPLGETLEIVLSKLSSPVEWVVGAEGALVTRHETATDTYQDVRVYDVTDLAEPVVTRTGIRWMDSGPLITALRRSAPEMGDADEPVPELNVGTQVFLVLNLSRRGHKRVSDVITKIRAAVNPESANVPAKRNLRIAEPRPPKTGALTELQVVDMLRAAVPGVHEETIVWHNEFAIDLFRQVRTETTGNFVICPFGTYNVLAMLSEGAQGAAERDLGQVLHLPVPNSAFLRQTINGLRRRFDTIDREAGYQLHIETRAWCQWSRTADSEYTRLFQDMYLTSMVGVPIQERPGEAALEMNEWVAEETGGRIPEILTPRRLRDSGIDFTITNANYFDGRWHDPFDPLRTAPLPFHSGSETFDVMMMQNKRSTCRYAEIDGVQLMDKWYLNGFLSMLVALPPVGASTLESLEKSLSTEVLGRWRERMKRAVVDTQLPRFEIQTEFPFDKAQRGLGLANTFKSMKDFPKMSTFWQVGVIGQKSAIKVNETGTESGAVNVVDESLPPPSQQPKILRADRPFLFLVLDKPTGLILFIGRVTKPELAMPGN